MFVLYVNMTFFIWWGGVSWDDNVQLKLFPMLMLR